MVRMLGAHSEAHLFLSAVAFRGFHSGSSASYPSSASPALCSASFSEVFLFSFLAAPCSAPSLQHICFSALYPNLSCPSFPLLSTLVPEIWTSLLLPPPAPPPAFSSSNQTSSTRTFPVTPAVPLLSQFHLTSPPVFSSIKCIKQPLNAKLRTNRVN